MNENEIYDEEEIQLTERQRLEEYEYCEWLRSLSTEAIVNTMVQEAAARGKGDEFTLPELLDDIWYCFDRYRRRQAAKNFKIMVIQRKVRSVYYLPRIKRDCCFIYVRY